MKHRYDSDQTVHDILTVASHLFTVKGYENTSIQDIVNELNGLTRGAVYHHFESKEDILIQVIQRIIPKSDYIQKISTPEEGNGLERLRHAVLTMMLNTRNHDNHAGYQIIENNPNILLAMFKIVNQHIVPQFAHLIEIGNADGSLNIEDPFVSAEALLMLFDTWFSSVLYPDTDAMYNDKLKVLKKCLDGMGLPILDTKSISLLSDTQ